MPHYTVYLYLETALHVSGGTITHRQECKQLYLQHLVFVTLSLLSAAIMEELEVVWVCCGWRKPPTAHGTQRQIAITVWQITDAVDTVVCAPDFGWWYHPKHVEQFPDKINCVKLHLVWYILEQNIRIKFYEFNYNKSAFSSLQLQQSYYNAWYKQRKKSHYFRLVLNLCIHKLELAICLLYIKSNLSAHFLYLAVHLTENSPYYKLYSIVLPVSYKIWTYLPTVYWHSQ